jgi:hypothetical protein
MQTFYMMHPEPPLHKFRWIAIPGHARFATSNYEDFFAMSTKLMHFVPVKSAKTFNPPTACIFHESSAFIVTSVGKEIKKYDICTGTYVGAFPVFSPYDLTALCQDGLRGRRLFCGNNKGTLYLLNFTDGSIIDELKVHGKEISRIVCNRVGDRTIIYTSSLDGCIALTEEVAGRLSVRSMIDRIFGPHSAVQYVEHAPSIRVLVGVSSKNFWGVWDDASLRKILCVREANVVNAVRIVGASRDAEDLAALAEEVKTMTVAQRKAREKEHLLTIAVALSNGINIYTMDTFDVRGTQGYQLVHKREVRPFSPLADVALCFFRTAFIFLSPRCSAGVHHRHGNFTSAEGALRELLVHARDQGGHGGHAGGGVHGRRARGHLGSQRHPHRQRGAVPTHAQERAEHQQARQRGGVEAGVQSGVPEGVAAAVHQQHPRHEEARGEGRRRRLRRRRRPRRAHRVAERLQKDVQAAGHVRHIDAGAGLTAGECLSPPGLVFTFSHFIARPPSTDNYVSTNCSAGRKTSPRARKKC